MSLAALLNRPVTIVHRADGGTIDDYGSPERAETLEVTTGELQQMTTAEQVTLGDFAQTVWRLFLPGDTTVPGPDDAIVIGDLTYEVVGDPWPVRNPRTGATSHIEAIVRRAGAASTVVTTALWDAAIWDQGVWN